MKCPVCAVPTYVVEYDHIELDLCASCEGMWFDGGELELLLGVGESPMLTPAETEEQGRACPLCRKPMDKVNIGPSQRVMVDTCPAGCGLWFDADELKTLSADLAADGWQVRPEVRRFLSEMFPQKGEEPC
jgi:Zn-finger nucleic acid-binding protein